MTDDELKAIDQRLAAMSERVDAVIERESRGKPMRVLKPRCKAKYVPPEPEISDEILRSATRNYYYPREQATDGSIEQVFAEFERQFDEMAQAHRYRA